jgi:hypothetical protein
MTTEEVRIIACAFDADSKKKPTIKAWPDGTLLFYQLVCSANNIGRTQEAVA